MATTVVQVMVLANGDDGPVRDPAATLSLEVGKKSSTVISRSHLAYTVSGNPLFTVFSTPSCACHTACLYPELCVVDCNHVLSLAGQCIPRRANSDPAGVVANVRHPNQEPVPAGAPGVTGVLVVHHGGHQHA